MRRGQGLVEWGARVMMLFAAVIILYLLVGYFADREIEADEIHKETYLNRILYDDIIMYTDVTGRTYPGVVDHDKFTPSQMNDRYGITGKISSKLTLSGCHDSPVIVHDSTTYETFEGLARFGTLGPGGATVQEENYPVTVIRNNNRCRTTLNITIVRPNS